MLLNSRQLRRVYALRLPYMEKHVKGHQRKFYKRRDDQTLKLRTMQLFAEQISGQFYRLGVSAEDERVVRQLRELLADVAADAPTLTEVSQRRRRAR